MRRFCKVILIFILMGGTVLPASSQFVRKRAEQAPQFFYKIVNFPGREISQSRLFVFLAIPYDKLVFVRTDSDFVAQYHFGIYLYGEKRNLLFEKNWRRKIHVKTFEETNRREVFDRFETSTTQVPGKYRLVLRLQDRQVPQPSHLEKEVDVHNFLQTPLQLSSLLLLNVPSPDSCKPGLLPQPPPRNNFAQNFFACFEATKTEPEPIALLFEVVGKNARTACQVDTLVFPAQASRKSFQIAVNVDSLQAGRFRILVRPLNIKKIKPAEADFWVAKSMEFKNPKDLDEAIAALCYIAEPEELSRIEKADSFTQKKKLFDHFWKRWDPTPETPFNELEVEYYNRVTYANTHFSLTHNDGWRTDRGRIYIVYGPPDAVEHQRDQEFHEYEIWHYHALKKKFVFWNQKGTGNYQLVRTN